MPTDVEDLLLLAWAAFEDREWVRAGTRIAAPAIGQLAPDMGLRPAKLPSEEEWAKATAAAQALFGEPRQPRRSAAGVARMASALRAKVAALRGPVTDLRALLERRSTLLGLDQGSSPRWETTSRAQELVTALAKEQDDTVFVQVLAL